VEDYLVLCFYFQTLKLFFWNVLYDFAHAVSWSKSLPVLYLLPFDDLEDTLLALPKHDHWWGNMVKTSYGPTLLSLISLIAIKYCEASTQMICLRNWTCKRHRWVSNYQSYPWNNNNNLLCHYWCVLDCGGGGGSKCFLLRNVLK